MVFAQVFQQEGFKRFIGTVDFIDQQNSPRGRCLQNLQQGPTDQKARLVNGLLDLGRRLCGLSSAHVQQLRRVVPLVQGFALLHAVVTLQA